MSERYFAKVASVRDGHTIVIAKGTDAGVKEGDLFLVVGLGDVILDPDTGETLEQLEVVRGKAKVIHAQTKVSTLQSSELTKSDDIREVKRVSSNTSAVLGIFGGSTVTESIKPGTSKLKEFDRVKTGDYVIKL
ncbi:hypothetical protein ACQKP5_15200 [Pseudomonas vancouverensis]|uniref:hypothetical protein n=1 Tax=Pseudomonas vancouverensis TaxID=95300 RepID=UPI003D08D7FF